MRFRPLLIGVACLIMFAAGEMLMMLSLRLIEPHSHYVSRYLWIARSGFDSGMEILLWPTVAVVMIAIWTVWAGVRQSRLSRGWDLVPALVIFLVMMLAFGDNSYPLVEAYCYAGASLASLLTFWALHRSADSLSAEG